MAIVVALLVAAVLAGAIALVAVRDDGSRDVVITIPPGTATNADVIDDIIRVDRDGEIIVRNRDDQLHIVGPITVEAGTTGRQTFSAEGRYSERTSLRADGRVTILVQKR